MRSPGVLAACLLLLAASRGTADEAAPVTSAGADVAAAATLEGEQGAVDDGSAAPLSDEELAEAAEYQPSKRQQCKRLVRQIDHFENTVLPMAESRKDALWAASTEDHIERLEGQLAAKCPQYAKERGAFNAAKQQAEELRQLMILAAKGAAKYFTGGWF